MTVNRAAFLRFSRYDVSPSALPWVEVSITQRQNTPSWTLSGVWTEDELEQVESALYRLSEGYVGSNYWELYKDTWGNTYRFIAKRWTMECGVNAKGDTVEELIDGLIAYYEREL